ncbi:MAG: hypothetical protein AAF580_06560 [Pseudomonadota bacterium]
MSLPLTLQGVVLATLLAATLVAATAALPAIATSLLGGLPTSVSVSPAQTHLILEANGTAATKA